MQIKRAYSLFEIKSANEERREITGIATTPSVDSYGDIVEPEGAEFNLPIPFLWQHNSSEPIGHVTKANVSSDGIEVTVQLAKTDEPGMLKDMLDKAWQSIKLKLVRGLSIGFSPIEYSRIEETYSYRYIKWAWRELSAVTIAANDDAFIQTVKSIKSLDNRILAASGHRKSGGVRLIPSPGVSGKPESAHRGSIKLIPRNVT